MLQNRVFARCFILLPFGILTAVCFSTEDDIEQAWPSPDGRLVLHHTATFDRRLIPWKKTENSYDLPAAYTLTRKGRVIWSVVSPVDESRHTFRCIWAEDSRSALILDRPARGDVEVRLVLPARRRKGITMHVQRMIDHVLAQAGDADPRHLQTAWFGDGWKFSGGRFEGNLHVAWAQYYSLHLVLDPARRVPRLKLIGEKSFVTWAGDRG